METMNPAGWRQCGLCCKETAEATVAGLVCDACYATPEGQEHVAYIHLLVDRYFAHAHRLQSAHAFRESHGDQVFTPKHMRVGIDLSRAEQGALIELLIRKGVLTQREWFEVNCAAAGREADDSAAAAQPYLPPGTKASFA